MKKAALIVLLSPATALAGPIACSSGKDKSSATYTLGTELGINKAAMDTGVKPGNDFYAYANGNWQKTKEIPADRASTGAFYTAFLATEKRHRELHASHAQGPVANTIGRASCKERGCK